MYSLFGLLLASLFDTFVLECVYWGLFAVDSFVYFVLILCLLCWCWFYV